MEELAVKDDPEAIICPVGVDGTPGERMTYAQLLKKNQHKTAFIKPSTPKPVAAASVPAGHAQPVSAPSAAVSRVTGGCVKLSPELEQTIIYSCRVFNVMMGLAYYGALLTVAGLLKSFEAAVGVIVLGIVFHVLAHYGHFMKRPKGE